MKLAELIELQRRSHGPRRVRDSVGDGYLYLENPVFRRVRDAALSRGFRFTAQEPGAYFGFPLIALDTLLETKKIPYRKNFPALVALERSRPGFFTLSDLRQNRPVPNYLLHESAHAIAFVELFGSTRRAHAKMSDPDALLHVMLGESFAMAAEYLAACHVSGSLGGWLFSVSSYRHRTQKKKAVGELWQELGPAAVTWVVLAAFLHGNFLIESLSARRVEAVLERSRLTAELRPSRATLAKLRSAASGLMVMSPEFRRDTARLFLTMHGHPRDVRRVLDRDPISLLDDHPGARAAAERLVRVLCEDP